MTFSRRQLKRVLFTVWIGGLWFAPGYTPAVAASAVQDEFQAFPVASPAKLDTMRGGFSFANGNSELQLSIGIDRAVLVDGNLKIASHFDIPLSANQMTQGANPATLNILQNGTGNFFTPSNSANLASAMTTLIQNSLDNQTISNLNIINASVSSLSLMRSMALANSLKEVIAGSIR